MVEASFHFANLPVHQIFSAEQAEVLGVPGAVGTGKRFTPTIEEYAAFEADLPAVLEQARIDDDALLQLDEWTGKSTGARGFARQELAKILDRLPDYRRQVFAVEIEGKRLLFVNMLPGADWDSFGDHIEDWRERPMMTSDGGFWYWAIAFDPQSGLYSLLDLHGYA